eukprot:GHVU01101787.1.p1 GENE.GHVU01101787.1~~GHVU01101787.1.p1  ORF type:complete len:120 (+),score=10.51 GHVU01101787.1:121-480(+)
MHTQRQNATHRRQLPEVGGGGSSRAVHLSANGWGRRRMQVECGVDEVVSEAVRVAVAAASIDGPHRLRLRLAVTGTATALQLRVVGYREGALHEVSQIFQLVSLRIARHAHRTSTCQRV